MLLNTHNARLMRTVQAASHTARTATTKQELLVAVDALSAFDGRMRFDNRLLWCILLASVPLLVDAWVNAQPRARLLTPLAEWLRMSPTGLLADLALGLFVAALLSLYSLRQRQRLIPDLTQALAERSSRITAGLRDVAVNDGHELKTLIERFRDYWRGEQRFLRRAVQGHYQGPLHGFSYRWYHLRYKDKNKYERQSENGEGAQSPHQGGSRRNQYDRFSLVLDFPWVKGIALRGPGTVPVGMEYHLRTTSLDFNQAFALSGTSGIACVRFARPPTVLHLIKLSHELLRPNLEFSLQGELCLSSDNDPLYFERTCDLSDPAAFRRLIDEGVQLPRLIPLLQMLHTLAEQHDDNFQLPARQQAIKEH